LVCKTVERKSQLVPRKVTIESSIKFFGLDIGRSEGSTVSVEFDLPEGMDSKEFRRAYFTEKEQLDLTTLAMEKARGSVKDSAYVNSRQRIKQSYDKILGRSTADEAGNTPAE